MVGRVCVVAVATMVHATLAQSPTPSPQAVIRNEATAIRVAEAILASQHSVRDMEGSRPYKAVLSRGVWRVWGTDPEGAAGVVPFVEIDPKAGCILVVGAHFVCVNHLGSTLKCNIC